MSTAYHPGPRPLCPHCKKNHVSPERRGLCQRCHKDAKIRALYPNAKPPGPGATPGRKPSGGRPDAPTDAPPGSEAKIMVMAERARKRQSLFHPADAKGAGADQGEPWAKGGPRLRVFEPLAS